MSCVSFRTTHQKDSTRIGLGQITLRMPVPLGRSFSDPSFLSSQIVVCVVLFHLILGVIAYGIAGASLLWRGDASSSDHHHPTVLILSTLTHHMKLSAIFAPTPLPPVVSEASIGGAPTPPSASTTSMDSITVGDDVRFLLLHIASAISFAVPFSRIVQRRKFVLDFVVTVYVLYSVAGSVVVGNWRAVPLSLWWIACVFGGCFMVLLMANVLIRRRELADIELAPLPPSSGLMASAPVPSIVGAGVTVSPSSNAMMMSTPVPPLGGLSSGNGVTLSPGATVVVNVNAASGTVADHVPLLTGVRGRDPQSTRKDD